MPTSHDDPLKGIKLSPKRCVTCDQEKDIPGFFCSSCKAKNASATPVLIDHSLIQDMRSGDSGYVNPLAIFDWCDLYWIIGNFPYTPRPTFSNTLKVARDIDGDYVFEPETMDFGAIEYGYPYDMTNLWLTRAYCLDHNISETTTIASLPANNLIGFTSPNSIFVHNELTWIITSFEVTPEETNTNTIKVWRNNNFEIYFEDINFNWDSVSEGWPENYSEIDVEPLYHDNDDDEDEDEDNEE